MRAFLAARVWASVEGPRALFDRAVVWLVDDRVLLPGITTLTRLVAETRAQKMAELYRTLDAAVPGELRQAMRELLKVPHGKRVSELERLRSGPVRMSGAAMREALDRAREVRALGAGLVDTGGVPASRMAALARYGLGSKAPALRDLEETRKITGPRPGRAPLPALRSHPLPARLTAQHVRRSVPPRASGRHQHGPRR
ncbi:hypothetical protein EES46_06985 [Streptomyces sp. ADI98-10]|nr:hypothetical protein EES46_06985 [Streptomyces sp. ADI98-10]